ncbi:hypothetical protein B0H10DRAFT_2057128 [Mycena sp. CBHHK59/15]|nr:hypothetical protein B0H10DRAFT_2057128 [Mycena sp. CBHHK59/15]
MSFLPRTTRRVRRLDSARCTAPVPVPLSASARLRPQHPRGPPEPLCLSAHNASRRRSQVRAWLSVSLEPGVAGEAVDSKVRGAVATD